MGAVKGMSAFRVADSPEITPLSRPGKIDNCGDRAAAGSRENSAARYRGPLMDVENKEVVVIGMGKSGLSAARWLAVKGAKVTISEMKGANAFDSGLIHELGDLGITLEMGDHKEETLLKSDLVVVSPGVPLELKVLDAARKERIPIVGEMGLAVQCMDTPMVAVTGTNGKSTVTAFLGGMLEAAGFKVFVGGNIGTPLIDYAAGDWKADIAILEVSSFQLDAMEEFRPMVSVVLNISPDHLDRYPSYEAYVQSKLRICRDQGKGQYTVLNDDDETLGRFEPASLVSVLRYGLEKRKNRQAYLEDHGIRAIGPQLQSHHFSLKKCPLPGLHNQENIMACVLSGLALNADPSAIQETIDHFRGLPDRIEWVGRIRNVDFYNDSKATNVDAAVRSLASFRRPIILIAGGRHKGGNYQPLVGASRGKVKKAILLGESRHLLAQSFVGVIPYNFAISMGDAVSQAFAASESGDVVLLAPSCSSFDMFTDYVHRGKVFREAVEGLKDGQ
jgi:UDP-N-acetylmuramoylalanine--D-glutamate ligase